MNIMVILFIVLDEKNDCMIKIEKKFFLKYMIILH